MAYDPRFEDYQRLLLRFSRSLDGSDPAAANRSFMAFHRQFAQHRDSLPQSDADRAFHLVAQATELIDYQLPFATDEEAETIISRGHVMLDEALSLDPACHDAVRMKVAAEMTSFEAYYDFLREGADEVKASCIRERDVTASGLSGEREEIAIDLAMRPYLRWIAMIAEKALICGRNREAIRYAREAIELDPIDTADTRFTAMLAYAKLEDEQGLDAFEREMSAALSAPVNRNAWSRLAHASLAYRARDFERARTCLQKLAKDYPHASVALGQQRELPDGVFARIAVAPRSEDELIVAISEATVLLQEGRDALGRGSFGAWVMLEALALATREELLEMKSLVGDAATALQDPLGGLDQGGAS